MILRDGMPVSAIACNWPGGWGLSLRAEPSHFLDGSAPRECEHLPCKSWCLSLQSTEDLASSDRLSGGGVYCGPSGLRNSQAGRRDNRPPTVLSFPPQENPRVDIPSHQRKPVVNNSTHQRELVVNKSSRQRELVGNKTRPLPKLTSLANERKMKRLDELGRSGAPRSISG